MDGLSPSIVGRLDIESFKLRAGWRNVCESISIPFFYRQVNKAEKKFCYVRVLDIVTTKHFAKVLPYLSTLQGITSISSFYLTSMERDLMEEINNQWGGFLGNNKEMTVNERIVDLDEAVTLMKFLHMLELKRQIQALSTVNGDEIRKFYPEMKRFIHLPDLSALHRSITTPTNNKSPVGIWAWIKDPPCPPTPTIMGTTVLDPTLPFRPPLHVKKYIYI